MKSLGLGFVIKNWNYSTWLVHFLTLKEFCRVFSLYVKKNGIVFDIGCSTKPYKALINKFTSKYYGLEHLETLHLDHNADVIGTAYNTGLKDESVDTVFSAVVLEHLEEPSKAILEMYRIAKNDGVVIITAPLFWNVHEAPRDFYRYTRYGLEYLLKKNGFEVLEIKAMAGFWVTFLSMVSIQAGRFNKGLLKFFPVIPLFRILLQLCAFILNKVDLRGDIWTWAYVAVGKKRS